MTEKKNSGIDATELLNKMTEKLTESQGILSEAAIKMAEQENARLQAEQKKKALEVENATLKSEQIAAENSKLKLNKEQAAAKKIVDDNKKIADSKLSAEEKLKQEEIDKIERAKLEASVKQKDEELVTFKARLEVIEAERKETKDNEHGQYVNSIVNKMVTAGLLKQDGAEEKFQSLKQLGPEALGEIEGMITTQLENTPAPRAVTPSSQPAEEPAEKTPLTEVKESASDIAFKKIQKLQNQYSGNIPQY